MRQNHTTRKGLVACYTSVSRRKPYSYIYDNTNGITEIRWVIIQICLGCVEKVLISKTCSPYSKLLYQSLFLFKRDETGMLIMIFYDVS